MGKTAPGGWKVEGVVLLCFTLRGLCVTRSISRRSATLACRGVIMCVYERGTTYPPRSCHRPKNFVSSASTAVCSNNQVLLISFRLRVPLLVALLSRLSSIDHKTKARTSVCCACRVEQTPNPVLELEYLRPVNSNGRRLDRSIILHFLSMGEFVDAVLQDDFELGVSFSSRVLLSALCRLLLLLCLLLTTPTHPFCQ